jgi:type IV pilus assembly protein PilW
MSYRAQARHRGFSIVELMVALTIGLMLLTLLAVILSNASRSQKETFLAAEQIENGRYAVDMLSDDIHHAGFWGYYSGTLTAPAGLPDPCDTSTAGLKAAMAIPLQGYNAPIATLPTCLAPANYLAGTDILVVRHASTTVTAPANLLASPNTVSTVFIQSGASPLAPGNPVVDTGGNPGNFTQTTRNGTGANVAAPIRLYETHVYFVSPCSVPTGSGGTVCTATDDGGNPVPTLKRLELDQTTGTMKITPLVQGIENLQVDYGTDSDGDGSPDSAGNVADPGAVANWQKVMEVQLYVLARNTQRSDYTDNKTYALGTAGNVTPSGNALFYRRHVYSAAIRVKNASERLETP